jgi:hypothetical protein
MGRIAILSDQRRAARVRSDNKADAINRTTEGCRCCAITSPSANQHTAVSRGARRNSSGGTRAPAFGQRSGFGPLMLRVLLRVFKALPADRTQQPFHHNGRDYMRNTTTDSR